MFMETLPKKSKITVRFIVINIILISGSFIWYFYAFNILGGIIEKEILVYQKVLILFVNFIGIVTSALVGAFLVNKTKQRVPLLRFWAFFGLISSTIPILIDIGNVASTLILSLFFGVSFGFGMPICMGYYADSIQITKRGRFAGFLVLIMGLGILGIGLISPKTLTEKFAVLSLLKTLQLIASFFIDSSYTFTKTANISYISILKQRPFILYFIPWTTFCLVNYAIYPVATECFGKELVYFFVTIENAVIGIFAIIGGFLSDFIGRKRLIILGFMLIGIGYAILSIYPYKISWYLHTITDGVAWGFFYTLFFFTLWGDLAGDLPSEKYYALGGIPYPLSYLLRILVENWIIKIISVYTIFSLASFFLFLAVIPLMYAPETLPEKLIRQRELKKYVEKAKKIREKYEKK